MERPLAELPGWLRLMLQGLAKNPSSRSTMPLAGHQTIDHVTILIPLSPEGVERAADLDEDLVDEPDVSESSLFTPKSSSTGRTEG